MFSCLFFARIFFNFCSFSWLSLVFFSCPSLRFSFLISASVLGG